MDRNEMAAFLNVSRPSMSREMMRMRDEGIMEFWKDKITIKNIQKLTAIVKRR
jgi:Mn-dependent DtxR family transcriptional regulator